MYPLNEQRVKGDPSTVKPRCSSTQIPSSCQTPSARRTVFCTRSAKTCLHQALQQALSLMSILPTFRRCKSAHFDLLYHWVYD